MKSQESADDILIITKKDDEEGEPLMAINETEEVTLEHQELDMQNVERSAVYLEVSPVNTNNGLTFESQKPVNMQQSSIAASGNVAIAIASSCIFC